MSAAAKSRVPFADPYWHGDGLSPFYNESHRQLQKCVRSYVDEHVRPYAQEWESQGYIPDEAFERHAAHGMLAVSAFPLPIDYLPTDIKLSGGVDPKDWDAFHDSIIIDEMARCGYLGVIWGINGGATVGGPPLAQYASHNQKQQWLAPLLKGKQRHCLAITEPGAGSDVAAIETTALKSDDGKHYIVNGSKKWITQGRWAGYVLCAVRTGGQGAKGISTLMIDMKAKGVSKKKMENSGVNASGSTFLEFDDVMVPKENLIGKENEGFAIVMSTFTHERLWVGITCLRLGRVALEDCYNYSLQRQTFGQPLFNNQVIRQIFTKMAGLLESTHGLMELLVYRYANTPQAIFSPYAALLKYKAARDLEKISREAQQIMGGVGYSRAGRGGRVEQLSRDVRVLVVSGGSEEILMDMVAKQQKRIAKL